MSTKTMVGQESVSVLRQVVVRIGVCVKVSVTCTFHTKVPTKHSIPEKNVVGSVKRQMMMSEIYMLGWIYGLCFVFITGFFGVCSYSPKDVGF